MGRTKDPKPLAGVRVLVAGVPEGAEDAVRATLRKLGAEGIDIAGDADDARRLLRLMAIGPVACRETERKPTKRPRAEGRRRGRPQR